LQQVQRYLLDSCKTTLFPQNNAADAEMQITAYEQPSSEELSDSFPNPDLCCDPRLPYLHRSPPPRTSQVVVALSPSFFSGSFSDTSAHCSPGSPSSTAPGKSIPRTSIHPGSLDSSWHTVSLNFSRRCLESSPHHHRRPPARHAPRDRDVSSGTTSTSYVSRRILDIAFQGRL
jgi:hypothetical protein